MDVPALSLTLLGSFELRVGGRVVPIESGRVRGLIGWLALHMEGVQPRERIACTLWPESSDGQARTNLRNLLHQLRRAVPTLDRYLETTAATIGWRVDAPIVVDAVAFEEALSAARGGAGGLRELAALEAALALYRGPLLPDVYEPWVGHPRTRLGRIYQAGLEALLERCLEQDEPRRALEVGDRILEEDALNERAHRARVTTLTALGDRAGAVRAYHECESRLAQELGIAPSRATRLAYEAALGSTGEPPAADPADRDAPVTATPREAPLVGRLAERAVLRTAWARALGEGTRVVWVTGEPGIGKTRLVQALAEWIERQGHAVVQARAYATQGALAYGPAIAWLRSRQLAPLVLSADAVTRAELARLLPELAVPQAEAEGGSLTEAEGRQRIHDAVLRILAAPAGPSALILDDLHWSDQETIDLLHAIALRSHRPILIAATVRMEEVEPDHALLQVAARLGEAGRLERLDLERLDLEETGLLARQLSGVTPSDVQLDELYRETEGNPLFIVESLRHGGRVETGTARPMSPRIRSVIEARLGLLSPDARTVVQVAATLGREFTLRLLLRVSPLDENATLRGLDEAWRRRLVRERADDSYDFTHEKIREVAYGTTSPVRRRLYHASIADTLARDRAAATIAPEITLDQIALHYDRAGAVAEAAEWYRRAAGAATEISALDAARQLLERALALLVRLPENTSRDMDELDTRLAFGAVLVALEGYGRPEIVRTYARARELCEHLGRAVPPPVHRALGLAALARGDLETGRQLAAEIAGSAAGTADHVGRVEGEYLAGVMAFWGGDLEESERRLAQAIAWYRPEHHREHVRLYAQDPKVVCLSRLAWTLWHRAAVGRALHLRDEALALAKAQGDPHGLAYALWFVQHIDIDLGDVTRITEQCDWMKRIASSHRLHYIEAVADAFLGYAATLEGDVRGGIARMRATLSDPRWNGMAYVIRPQTLVLIARAAAGAGDTASVQAAVREALDFLGRGSSIWKPALHSLAAQACGQADRTGQTAVPAFTRALQEADRYGTRWIALKVSIDFASWCIERGSSAGAEARDHLTRALDFYADAPRLPAVVAGNILVERLGEEAFR